MGSLWSRCSCTFSRTVPRVIRFSSRSALGPPHDGIRRARRLNLVHDLANLGSAGSGLSTRSPRPSSPRNDPGIALSGESFVRVPCSFDLSRSRCQCGRLLSKAELGCVGPHAVQDDAQFAGHRHAGTRHAAASGDVHAPGAQARPFLRAHEQRMRRLVEGGAGEFVCG